MSNEYQYPERVDEDIKQFIRENSRLILSFGVTHFANEAFFSMAIPYTAVFVRMFQRYLGIEIEERDEIEDMIDNIVDALFYDWSDTDGEAHIRNKVSIPQVYPLFVNENHQIVGSFYHLSYILGINFKDKFENREMTILLATRLVSYVKKLFIAVTSPTEQITMSDIPYPKTGVILYNEETIKSRFKGDFEPEIERFIITVLSNIGFIKYVLPKLFGEKSFFLLNCEYLSSNYFTYCMKMYHNDPDTDPEIKKIMEPCYKAGLQIQKENEEHGVHQASELYRGKHVLDPSLYDKNSSFFDIFGARAKKKKKGVKNFETGLYDYLTLLENTLTPLFDISGDEINWDIDPRKY